MLHCRPEESLMDVFAGVKKLMQKERDAHVREIAKLDAALAALGYDGISSRRTMSVAARRRVSAAQKARWAKVRAGKK